MAGAGRAPNIGRERELLNRKFQYRWRRGADVSSDGDLLAACIGLFDRSYGVWGPVGPRPGSPVRLDRSRLQRLLDAPDAWMASAWLSNELVGYCIVSRVGIANRGIVNWVTQLVVREDVRAMRIATQLLYSVWQFSDCYAWGLATANPFAVRALETATRRGCRRSLVVARGDEVCRALSSVVEYIPDHLEVEGDKKLPVIDTKFYVAHTRMKRMKERAARAERPWALGDLDEGQEWFAITFADQSARDVGRDRLEHLLQAGDAAWIDAYERMSLDSQHQWHRHAAAEVALLKSWLPKLPQDARVLDIGCGDGRHVRELLDAGFDAYGLDIAPGLIARAQQVDPDAAARFRVYDGRSNPVEDDRYDLVTLLYDVIGSSASRDDDLTILRNARAILAPDGMLVLSVMNREGVDALLPATQIASDQVDLVAKLEALAVSNAMESTGSVFDPEYIVKHQDVYFRKEQFLIAGDTLPAEIIVRDRRFAGEEIVSLVGEAGFSVLSVTPVQAGHWDRQPTLAANDLRAKEWLVIAALSEPGSPSLSLAAGMSGLTVQSLSED